MKQVVRLNKPNASGAGLNQHKRLNIIVAASRLFWRLRIV
jgi:hypothetical protein